MRVRVRPGSTLFRGPSAQDDSFLWEQGGDARKSVARRAIHAGAEVDLTPEEVATFHRQGVLGRFEPLTDAACRAMDGIKPIIGSELPEKFPEISNFHDDLLAASRGRI